MIYIPIPGYEDLYAVSEYGEVISYGFVKCKGGNLKRKKKKAIAQEMGIGRMGIPNYWRVSLWKNGRKWKVGVHQLVALSFIGPCPDGFTVNHKDGLKTNNHRSNLEYLSRSENQIHAYANGLQKRQKGQDRPMAKLDDNSAIEIKRSNLSAKELSKKYMVSESLVYMIRSGRRWSHIY